MGQPSDTRSDEPTLDDLLWELDVTTARSAEVAPQADAPSVTTRSPRAPKPPRAARPQRAAAAPKAEKPPKRGRFHRPELETSWERISRNRAVQVVSGTILLGGTTALVVAALSR